MPTRLIRLVIELCAPPPPCVGLTLQVQVELLQSVCCQIRYVYHLMSRIRMCRDPFVPHDRILSLVTKAETRGKLRAPGRRLARALAATILARGGDIEAFWARLRYRPKCVIFYRSTGGGGRVHFAFFKLVFRPCKGHFHGNCTTCQRRRGH